MNMVRTRKKRVVELTALLDLLFVMIFVSLLQTKNPPAKAGPVPTPAPEVTKTEAVPAPALKPVEKKGKIAVAAIFHFHSTDQNPSIPAGKYAMEGTFNQDNGSLQLGGLEWIDRPENYDMVPLKGKINETRSVFTGNIEFPQCLEFKLHRTTRYETSPIAGVWEGKYVCSQGETGLTLTIQ